MQTMFFISNNHFPQMFNNLKMQIHLIIRYFKYTIRKTFGVIAICINLQSLFANNFLTIRPPVPFILKSAF